MDDVDLDQLDGMAGREPPLTMLVHIGGPLHTEFSGYRIMRKRDVRRVIDEFREKQAILGEGILVAPFPSSESETP